MKKILHIGKYFYPVKGGMENHVYELTSSLKDAFDITILVFNTKNSTETEFINGVKVIRAARLCNLFSTPISLAMLKYIKEFNGDIIHLHLPNPVASMLYLKAKPRAKLIISYQYDITRQKILGFFYNPFLNIILQKADKIIVTAQNNLTYSPILKKYSNKCLVIPLGIDPQKFQITEEVISEAQEIKKKYPNKIVLFVGRLTYYKGVEYLINASKNQDFTVLLIGSGDEEQKLRELAKNAQNIHFLTNIEDLRAYYHASDVLVLPSIARSEAFGIVQLEAMICGKPVICTNLKTGVPSVQEHGKTGLVVEPRNAKALTDAITSLLNSPDKLQAFGSAARKRVLEKFTSEKNAAAHAKLYAELLT